MIFVHGFRKNIRISMERMASGEVTCDVESLERFIMISSGFVFICNAFILGFL